MQFVLLIFAGMSYFVPNEMVHLAILVLHVVVGIYYIIRLLDRQPLSGLFTAAYILMFFVNPIGIHIGLVDYESPSMMSLLYKSNALMMAGLDLFLIATIYFRGRRNDFKQMPPIYIRSAPVELMIWSGTMISVSALVAIILGGKALGVDVFTIEKSYRTTGNQTYTYLFATYATMILPFIFFFLPQRKFSAQIAYLITLICVLVLYFMIFRNRTLVLACVGAYIVGVVAQYRFLTLGTKQIKGKLPRLMIAAVVVSGPLLYTTGIALRFVRGAYQIQDFTFTQEHLQREIDHSLTGGELGYAFMTREALRLFPSAHPYIYGESYYRLAFIPIPRQVWPGKPESTNRLFARVRDTELGKRGVTQSAGIVGTLYINFGPLGVFGMIGFGIVFARENYVRLHHIMMLSASGLWMMAIVRGSLTAPIMTIIVLYLIARLVQRLANPTYIGHQTQ